MGYEAQLADNTTQQMPTKQSGIIAGCCERKFEITYRNSKTSEGRSFRFHQHSCKITHVYVTISDTLVNTQTHVQIDNQATHYTKSSVSTELKTSIKFTLVLMKHVDYNYKFEQDNKFKTLFSFQVAIT